MRPTEPPGLNRTGIQMAPFDSRAMQTWEGTPPDARFDDAAMAALRGAYIQGADQLGSVPLPVNANAAAKVGQALRHGDSPHMLLDKLGERLAFERTSTRLYDALITKCRTAPDPGTSMTLAELQEIRDDEARHFLLAAEAIETLGGDATALTPSADLVGVETMGLVQVLADPRTTVAQSLHAILMAELADQVGWEALIMLADEYGQDDMVSSFSAALDDECGHLVMIQTWYEESIGLPEMDESDFDDLFDDFVDDDDEAPGRSLR